MASELKVDKFTGVTTAGSIDVTGEGNSTTTNLQQGLCKVWCKTSANGETINDSFNIASLTDVGTGIQDFNFSNNMNNANYASQLTSCNNNIDQHWANPSASVCRGHMYDGSGYQDIEQSIGVLGDLA